METFYLETYSSIAQSVEQGTENPRVGGSIPPLSTTKLNKLWSHSSVGRAPALQAGGQEFESLHLHLIQCFLYQPCTLKTAY